MQEMNIVNLLLKLSGEITVSALIACAVALFAKRKAKLAKKQFFALSFGLGVLAYVAFDLALLGSAMAKLVTNAITCGAVALTVSLFCQKVAFMQPSDIKTELEKLLSSIVLSGQLDEIVDDILFKLSSQNAIDKDSLKEVIKNNLSTAISTEELDAISDFIISICKDKTE